MSSNPAASFVVLSYNRGTFLKECIDSILNQEGPSDFEIVIVDDASTDDTEEVLRRYSNFQKIRIIRHSKNLGHAATVNDGIAASRGQFIARIDSDDRYRPDFLKTVLVIFEKYPEAGLVYGDAALINEKGEITQTVCDSAHHGRDFKGNEFLPLLEKNFICAPTVIARREAWLGALPVPPHLAFHDWYFTLRMAERYEFYYVSRVLADYRVHAGNLHSSIARDKSEESSVFWLLDQIFETAVVSQNGFKQKVYARHYLNFGNKYFGFGMREDARRCYKAAFEKDPALLFKTPMLRRYFSTWLGQKSYEWIKRQIQSA